MLSGTTSHRRVPGASEWCLCSQSCLSGSSRFLDRICVGCLWHIHAWSCMHFGNLWHTPLAEKMRQWNVSKMFLTFSNETSIFFHCWIRRRLGSMLSTNLKLEAGKWIQHCLRGSRAIALQELLQMPSWPGLIEGIMQYNQSLQHILNKPSLKILIS